VKRVLRAPIWAILIGLVVITVLCAATVVAVICLLTYRFCRAVLRKPSTVQATA